MTIRFYSEESVPVEMHRARIVQKLQLLTIEERLEKIQEAGNNTFLLYNKDIYLDMLTDSGVNAMSDEMQAAMFVADDSYAGSSTYLKMANKLKEIVLKIEVKAGDNGKIFGGVTSKEISENLKTQYNIDVDKKKIVLKETIKVLGTVNVDIKLYEGVLATLKVNTVA